MVKSVLLVLILICSSGLYSQNQKELESLEQQLKTYEVKSKAAPPTLADTVKVNLLNQIAAYTLTSHPQKAISCSNDALLLSKKIGFKNGIGYSLSNLCSIYDFKGNYPLAINYAFRSIAIFKQTKGTGLADNYSQLGILYSEMGNYPESLKYNLLALKLYEERKNDMYAVKSYANIGILYKQQQRYAEALVFYNKAFPILDRHLNDLDNAYFRCYIKAEIGQVYLKQGHYNKSLQLLTQVLEKAATFEDYYLLATIYTDIASNYNGLQDYAKSLDYNFKALGSYHKAQDLAGEADCYINIGYSYFKQGNYPTAIAQTKKGLAIAQQVGQLEWIRKAYSNLSEIYRSDKDYKNAYYSAVSFKKINDSLFNSEKDKKFTQFELNYTFGKKQRHLKALQQKRDILFKVAIEQQRKETYSILVVLFFISFFAAIIFFNLRKKQRQKQTIEDQKLVLEQQNEQIQYSLTEKETLLREIHHRVKNNLQIISSLLSIQSHGVEDAALLSNIHQGQSRVHALSLIHQNLYQSTHISTVNIKNYLEELIHYLAGIYELADQAVTIEISMGQQEFDIDTAIPLGLILNELLSNTYANGFKDGRQGSIVLTIKAINAIDHELTVANNGSALHMDFDLEQPSAGLKLVQLLARQLRGALTFESDTKLWKFTVTFKDIKAYQNL